MKLVEIEWRHLEKVGDTCRRCAETGAELQKLIPALKEECLSRGAEIRFKETRLGPGEIEESNAILVNGVKIEDALPGVRSGLSRCSSCCDLIGKDSCLCRTLETGGRSWEAIPGALVRSAVCRIAQCC